MVHSADVRDDLIERYIMLDPSGQAANAAVADSGVEVWAIIGYLRGASIDQTALDDELPREAVEAEMLYSIRHQAVIQARLTLNDAAFVDDR